mmetsp:Transcript_24210/g.46916  ORF Transcript_24210/g.46916 Transcript_24210/m.46916 type:complete len:204 (-) Transcript_24210:375-986(-)
MPSSFITSVCAGFFMSIANSALEKASVFHERSSVSNWQWSNTGGACSSTVTLSASAAASSPYIPCSPRCHIMSLRIAASASPLASAARAWISPMAVSPCLPRSASQARMLAGLMPIECSQCTGTMCPWGESEAPVTTRLPARSWTEAMPASRRARHTVRKSQSTSRMPRLTSPGWRLCASTCARGPFHAMSMTPPRRAETCAS